MLSGPSVRPFLTMSPGVGDMIQKLDMSEWRHKLTRKLSGQMTRG